MGYKTKVQLIKRKTSEQWYVNFPMVLAQAMEFKQSEEVEWVVTEDGTLILSRPNAEKRTAVKKTKTGRI
jgi:antitoxin component of MazEF toxin-antitoxin module